MEDYSIEKSGDADRISKLNSGQLTNFALHDLFIEFFRKFKNGNLMEANAHLECIWIILGGDEKELSEVSKDYNRLNMNIGKLGYLGNPSSDGFKKLDNKTNREIKTKQKEAIKEMALFLRRLLNKQGKGTAYDDGEAEDMD